MVSAGLQGDVSSPLLATAWGHVFLANGKRLDHRSQEVNPSLIIHETHKQCRGLHFEFSISTASNIWWQSGKSEVHLVLYCHKYIRYWSIHSEDIRHSIFSTTPSPAIVLWWRGCCVDDLCVMGSFYSGRVWLSHKTAHHRSLHFHCHHGLLQGLRPLTAQKDRYKVTGVLCCVS